MMTLLYFIFILFTPSYLHAAGWLRFPPLWTAPTPAAPTPPVPSQPPQDLSVSTITQDFQVVQMPKKKKFQRVLEKIERRLKNVPDGPAYQQKPSGWGWNGYGNLFAWWKAAPPPAPPKKLIPAELVTGIRDELEDGLPVGAVAGHHLTPGLNTLGGGVDPLDPRRKQRQDVFHRSPSMDTLMDANVRDQVLLKTKQKGGPHGTSLAEDMKIHAMQAARKRELERINEGRKRNSLRVPSGNPQGQEDAFLPSTTMLLRKLEGGGSSLRRTSAAYKLAMQEKKQSRVQRTLSNLHDSFIAAERDVDMGPVRWEPVVAVKPIWVDQKLDDQVREQRRIQRENELKELRGDVEMVPSVGPMQHHDEVAMTPPQVGLPVDPQEHGPASADTLSVPSPIYSSSAPARLTLDQAMASRPAPAPRKIAATANHLSGLRGPWQENARFEAVASYGTSNWVKRMQEERQQELERIKRASTTKHVPKSTLETHFKIAATGFHQPQGQLDAATQQARNARIEDAKASVQQRGPLDITRLKEMYAAKQRAMEEARKVRTMEPKPTPLSSEQGFVLEDGEKGQEEPLPMRKLEPRLGSQPMQPTPDMPPAAPPLPYRSPLVASRGKPHPLPPPLPPRAPQEGDAKVNMPAQLTANEATSN